MGKPHDIDVLDPLASRGKSEHRFVELFLRSITTLPERQGIVLGAQVRCYGISGYFSGIEIGAHPLGARDLPSQEHQPSARRSLTTSLIYRRSHGSGSSCVANTSARSPSAHDSVACAAASRICTSSRPSASPIKLARHTLVPGRSIRPRQRSTDAAKLGSEVSREKALIHSSACGPPVSSSASAMIDSTGWSKPFSRGSVSKAAWSWIASRSRLRSSATTGCATGERSQAVSKSTGTTRSGCSLHADRAGDDRHCRQRHS